MDRHGLAYLHIAEAEWSDAPTIDESFRKALRLNFTRTLIVAGRYDLARAEQILDAGYADLVAFGRSFIANPDLPERLINGWLLNELQYASLFGGSAEGYTSYPAYRADGFEAANTPEELAA
jgi:N-ethylmaleimide reductase